MTQRVLQRFTNRLRQQFSKRSTRHERWSGLEGMEPRLLMSTTPVINEFLAENDTILADNEGDFEDWIELHNPTGSAVDLSGWYLTDDASNLMKWTIPSLPMTTLDPDEYLVLFASSKDTLLSGINGDELHTNFKLGSGGEYLALVQPDGTTVAYEYSPEYPEQSGDIAYGIDPSDGVTQTFLEIPTPGAENIVFDPNEFVKINEIMFRPDTDGDTGSIVDTDSDPDSPMHEWIELYNSGTEAVDLTGWSFVNGVDFVFPTISIDAGGYVIVAADAATFMADHPGVDPSIVVGGWTGQLSNSSEVLELEDTTGERIDRVEYADEGDWADRVLTNVGGRDGWEWLNEADGRGSSLEVINPGHTNNNGQNWDTSTVDGGTPGVLNSVNDTDIAPLISNLSHFPVVPDSTQDVTLTVNINDEAIDNAGVSVNAFYRVDGAQAFTQVIMRDDGTNGDETAGDGKYTGVLPAQGDGTIVEFYVQSIDGQNNVRTWPAPGIIDGQNEQVINAHYMVEDNLITDNNPIYRFITTADELAARDNIVDNDGNSDAQRHFTFISYDGVNWDVTYNAGLRNRGNSSRFRTPHNIRVNVPSDNQWKGIDGFSLNTQYAFSQIIGDATMRAAGLVSEDTRPAMVLLNGDNRIEPGDPGTAPGAHFGYYAHVEALNGDFVDNHYPLDNDGVLIRALGANTPLFQNTNGFSISSSEESGTLDQLQVFIDTLNSADDETFFEEISTVMNVDQWLRFFATLTLMGHGENSVFNGRGDDMVFYHGANDLRMEIIAHDFDTTYGQGDGSAQPVNMSIFRPEESGSVLGRLFENPTTMRMYYEQLVELSETVFEESHIEAFFDQHLGGWVSESTITEMKNWMDARRSYVLSQIPDEFTVNHNLSSQFGIPTIEGGSTPQTGGLVARYQFEDSGNLGLDTSGNSNNGNNNGVFPSGALNDGSGGANWNDRQDDIEAPITDLDANEGSVAFWMNYDGNRFNRSRYVLGHQEDQLRLWMSANNNNLRLDIGTSSFSSVGSITTNQDAHIAITWDSNSWTVYVNGTESDSGTYSGTINNTNLILGNRLTGSGNSFMGVLDDVQIYDAPLSASEVNTVMNGGTVANPSGVTTSADLIFSGNLQADKAARVTVNGDNATIDQRNGTYTINMAEDNGPVIPGTETTLLATESTWDYLDQIEIDNGGSPEDYPTDGAGRAWNDPNFNIGTSDASIGTWETGDAGFELGTINGFNGGANTTLDGDSSTNTTYLFRTTFETTTTDYESLIINMLADDGAVVYLNGTEIVRYNMPGGNVDTTTFAGGVGDEDNFIEHNVDPAGLLVVGTNHIAVEVHQISTSSSDLGLDMEIIGSTAPIEPPGGDLEVIPGMNRYIVRELDANDNILNEEIVDVWFKTNTTTDVSGSINSNTTWLADDGPYLVTGNLTVESGATLTIEDGTTVFFAPGVSMDVLGTLDAVGTETRPIFFRAQPDNVQDWDGINFVNAAGTSTLTHVEILHANGATAAVSIANSDVNMDQIAINPDGVIGVSMSGSGEMTLKGSKINQNFGVPSMAISDVTGSVQIEDTEFGFNTGDGAVVRVVNSDNVAIYNSTFEGGGDNGVELLSSDAYLEGNTFSNFSKDSGGADVTSAILIASDGTNGASTPTLARNLIHNVDNGITIVDGSLINAHSNTITNASFHAINFADSAISSTPGIGGELEGMILYNNVSTFNALPVGTVTVDYSILPTAFHTLGAGNGEVDPMFVNDANDFNLQMGSPAAGFGEFGETIGHLAAPGATIGNQPIAVTSRNDFSFEIGGPGIASYRYSLNDGPINGPDDVGTFLQLPGVVDAEYRLEVWGIDANGNEQAQPTVINWTVDSTALSLVINEVLAVNDTIEVDGDFPDLIELYNDGEVPIDLAGLAISDNPDNPGKHIFPAGIIINPGQYYVLIADSSPMSGHVDFSLNGDGEGVYLYQTSLDGNNEVQYELIDSVEFGVQVQDLSIGRAADQSWGLAKPTLGSANIMQQTGDVNSLKINEFLANGDFFISDDYIELYNPLDVPIDLGGLFITDDQINFPTLHEIASLTYIPANGYALFTPDGNTDRGPEHLDFKLSADMETITLLNSDQQVIDHIVYGPQRVDVSQGRTPDGGPAIVFFDIPNPLQSNPVVEGPGGGTLVDLLEFDDNWRYEYTGTDLGTGWEAVSFNDNGWANGPGVLGYDTNPDVLDPTGLTFGTFFDSAPGELPNYPITSYYRSTFTYNGDLTNAELRLSHVIDDGAVFYLNGQELTRFNMPGGEITFDTLADGSHESSDLVNLVLPADLLQNGTNTLAVELHQSSSSSSDAVFGMALDVFIPDPDVPTQSNTKLLIDELRITELMYHPGDVSNPEFIELQNTGNENIQLEGVRFTNGIDFTFPQMTLAAGEYVVVVSDLAAFEAKYDTSGMNIAGQYSGLFANGGENVELTLPSPLEGKIHDFTYDDAWFVQTDGGDYSLVPVNVNQDVEAWETQTGWRSTYRLGGSPGAIDVTEAFPPQVNGLTFDNSEFMHQLFVSFTEYVGHTLTLDDITIENTDTNTPVDPADMLLEYNVQTHSAGISFPGLTNAELPVGNYSLTVGTLNVKDLSDNRLDGDGNGVGGDDFVTSFEVTSESSPITVTVNTLSTMDNTPELTGDVDDPAASISVAVDGQVLTATNNADGTWTLADNALSMLADGTYDVAVTATNTSGDYTDNTTGELTIDATAPTVSLVSVDHQTLVLQFSEDVSASLTPGDIVLNNISKTTTVATGDMSLVYNGDNSVTVTFPGLANGLLSSGRYQIIVSSAGVTDAIGNTLDGDNNGSAGGDSINAELIAIEGDATFDDVIDLADLAKLATFFGVNGNWEEGDFTDDNIVDLADLAKLATNFGKSTTDFYGGGAASDDAVDLLAAASDSTVAEPANEAILTNTAGSSDSSTQNSWSHIDNILNENEDSDLLV